MDTLLAGISPVREEPIPHPRRPESAAERAARFVTTVTKQRLQRRKERWWALERRARRMGWPLAGAVLLGAVGLLVVRLLDAAPPTAEGPSVEVRRAEAPAAEEGPSVEVRRAEAPAAEALDAPRARREEIPPPEPANDDDEGAGAGAAGESSSAPRRTTTNEATSVPTEENLPSPSRARRTISAPTRRSDLSRSQ